MTPLVRFLPVGLRARLARNFTLWGLVTRPAPDTVASRVRSIRLLTPGDMRRLFPDARSAPGTPVRTHEVSGCRQGRHAHVIREVGHDAERDLPGCLPRRPLPRPARPVPDPRALPRRGGAQRRPAGLAGGEPEGLRALLREQRWRVVRPGADRATRAVGNDWPPHAETMVGLARLANVRACVTAALADGVPGDLVETGVWRGGTAIYMRAILAALGDAGRTVWACDSFDGLPEADAERFPDRRPPPPPRAPRAGRGPRAGPGQLRPLRPARRPGPVRAGVVPRHAARSSPPRSAPSPCCASTATCTSRRSTPSPTWSRWWRRAGS